MKVSSWLAGTFSTATKDSSIPPQDNHFQSPKHPLPSPSNSSDSSVATTSSDTSTVSLHSNLSIQTLPSVPSLQKISLDPATTVSSYLVTTLIPGPNRPITCLAVHNHLLYAATAHGINVYDQTNYTHLDAFNTDSSSTGSVKSVVLSDGKIFTAHQDSKIRVWKMTTPSKHHSIVTSLPTRNDRLRRFLLPKNYVTVRRHRQVLWINHADAVTSLAVRNAFLYSVSWDKTLKIWRLSDLRCLESIRAHDDAVSAVVVSPGGTVYTGSADRRIRVWARLRNEKRHALVATLEKHKSAVNALALSDDGSMLFSGACDRSILVWEREDSASYMAVVGALRGHGKAILSLVNVRDTLFSGSADCTVRIWQRGGCDGKFCCLNVLEGHGKPVKSLTAVEEDGSTGVVSVFSGSLDGEIRVWRVSVCARSSSPDVPRLNSWENY